MRIVLDTGRGEHELVVTADAAATTVGEVLAAAGAEPVAAVTIDGRRVPTDHTVAEAAIPDGATVVVGGPDARSGVTTLVGSSARPVPRLSVVTGIGAGASVALDGAVVVGRDAGCDLVVGGDTVSRRHCRVVRDGSGAVTVTDLGTTNGTWVGGVPAARGGTTAAIGAVVRVGAVVLRVEPVAADDRPRGLDPLRHLGPAGAVPFNRPPRPGPPPPVPPVAVPQEAPAAPETPPFNLAALVAPLVLGAVMVVALGSWRYAAFMALSPVLLLANTLSNRRRVGRAARTAARAHRDDLARFERGLRTAAEAERARSWALLPSAAEVRRRADDPSTRLWERRHHHDDALRLLVGVGSVPWSPPLTAPVPAGPAAAVLERWGRLARCPVGVDLGDGGVVGIVGDRAAATALARSLLLQACVHHGPADLAVAVVAAPDAVGAWDWATWLPHTAVPGPGGRRRLAAGDEQGRELLRGLREAGERSAGAVGATGAPGEEPTLLLVLDATEHLRGRDADARALLRGAAGPVAGIVLADTADQLPAVCDTVVDVAVVGASARLVRPAERTVVDDLDVAGSDVSTCRRLARRLAGFEDPELVDGAAQLPDRVDLVRLLPDDPTDATGVAAAWARTAAGGAGIAVPIGVDADGPVWLDLVEDGPHGLLGGTTGSGKSELLRSLVAGVAATHDPEHVTFVLVDYKGGAAFDACAGLPHVVGLVTDLDEHLGERALRCLEAELGHRERRLRDAGASDLSTWHRLPVERRGAPLPRLLVVIDEFATLRAELPTFVEALVGIAQRGRSLGVHLLLGTQRPSGAVDENVRANANLRIALRMTDERDALDVVGVPDAATVPTTLPGRGLLRRGPTDPVPLQTALVTGCSAGGGPAVRVAPLSFGPVEDASTDTAAAPPASGPSDLERLVAACRAAAAAGGHAPPRRPWPEPLPAHQALPPLLAAAPGVPVPLGLLDDPDRQRQVPAGWDPARGNLLVYGAVGSGTTTTLTTVALSAAQTHSPDTLHLHALDLGRGALAPLAALPHCGAVVTTREPERRQRLRAWLVAEGERRRRLSHAQLDAEPLEVVLVDGLEAWLDELDDPASYDELEAVQRLLVDAPGLRMAFVCSVTRAGAVRSAITTAVEQRLVHRLADVNDHAALGLRPGDVPPLPPGRAVRAEDGRLLQVAQVPDVPAAVAAIAAAAAPVLRPPAAVGSLPAELGWGRVAGAAAVGPGRWELPVGLDAATLAPVTLALHPGDHALVLGPPASGRSGLLGGLAALVAAGGVADVVVVAGPDGPLLAAGHRAVAPEHLGALLHELAATDRPTLVVVDDAYRVPDPGPALDLLGDPVRVVAAARQEHVQADYGHWLRRLARSRSGLFLAPTGDVPGDLLGARVPRRPPITVRPGRGWVVGGGTATFVQTVGPHR